MKEQYVDEKFPYFTENQTKSDIIIRTSPKEEVSVLQHHYITFSAELYKTPRAYRRVIGYVKLRFSLSLIG